MSGDGLSLKFYLSQEPFAQAKPALIDEEYLGPDLDPTIWVVIDPSAAVSVVAQTLQIAGGTGVDGQTTVSFIEQIELGGALELQHGDVSFTAASQGVLGGFMRERSRWRDVWRDFRSLLPAAARRFRL